MKSLLRFFAALLTGWIILSPLAAVAEELAEPVVVTEDREFRLRGFAQSIEKGAAADAGITDARAAFFRTRSDNRSACRDDLRRANKTALLNVLLTCYGSELAALKDFSGKQKTALQTIAGLTPLVRTEAVRNADRLIDAISAILFAISSGVYDSQEGLIEAKQNLYAKYQLPLWESWMTVRIDRTLTWTAYLIARIDALRAQESEKGLNRAVLNDTRACLVTQETALRPLLKPDVKDRAQQFPGILTALQGCLKSVNDIPRALTSSGAVLQ